MRLFLLGTLALFACSSDSGSGNGSSGAASGSSSGGSGSSSSSSGTASSSSGGTGTPGDAQTPPTGEASAIDTWLKGGEYKAWKCQAAPKDTGGVHGKTRVCSNTKTSTGTAPFQDGSASVKEIYTGDSVTGYAASVKVGGKWYWFEKLGSSVAENGFGPNSCESCHVGAGTSGNPGADHVYTVVK